MIRIGLVSDTHGLLRPEVRAFLRGSGRIVHAGDICGADILGELAGIAPLTAVRGNCDRGPWAEPLPETALLVVDGIRIRVIHDLHRLDRDTGAAGVRVVVSGQSHQPLVEERGGVLFVNPGSCGPRRFRLPVSVAELIVDGLAVSARIVEI
jgi:hypothetical protein